MTGDDRERREATDRRQAERRQFSRLYLVEGERREAERRSQKDRREDT